MKVIAVDTRPKNPAMQAVRKELVAKPPVGWDLVLFDSAQALLDRLAAVNPAGDIFEQIEVVAEGSPLHLDSIEFQISEPGFMSPDAFGAKLAQIPGAVATTVLYLSGCNTGLKRSGTPLNECIAQTIANASRTVVCGAAGYITGMHATQDERCDPDLYGEPSYSGARKAAGRTCWNKFEPGKRR